MPDNEITPSWGEVGGQWLALLKDIPGAGRAIARLVTGGAQAGAAWIDVLTAKGQQVASEIRDDTSSATTISKALAKEASKSISAHPELVDRALAAHVSDAVRKQENREGVARVAIDDLSQSPPPPNAPDVDDDWMNKFQHYAEEATSEQLRQIWGKVLASEIRSPGTVTPKSMRVISEIDRETAELFNRICRYRTTNAILKCLSGELSFSEMKKLADHDLVFDPGLTGHIRKYIRHKTQTCGDLWIINFEKYIIAFPTDVNIAASKNSDVISYYVDGADKCPKADIYLLTSAGYAISQILERDIDGIVEAYTSKLIEAVEDLTLLKISLDAKGQPGEVHVIKK